MATSGEKTARSPATSCQVRLAMRGAHEGAL